MTPLNAAGESAAMALAAMALAAMVTVCQLQGFLRGKKSKARVKQILDLTPLPPPPPLMNQGLDQKQTLRPLRQIESLKKKLQSLKRRSLFQIPTCLSPWTTLGRTLHLLMNPQMLRVVNYIWILCWIQHNPTLYVLVSQRGDAREGLFLREAQKATGRILTRRSQMETPNQFQIYQ